MDSANETSRLLDSIGAEILEEISNVKKVRDDYDKKLRLWESSENAEQKAQLKVSWELALSRLVKAEQELTDLRRNRETLLGQRSSHGEGTIKQCLKCSVSSLRSCQACCVSAKSL